jgi:hypothetical protein
MATYARGVRRLVTTEVGLVVAVLVGVLTAYVGLAVLVSGDQRLVGGGVLVLGLWVVLAALSSHDRAHRERGEAGHLLWLWGARRNPPWRRTP